MNNPDKLCTTSGGLQIMVGNDKDHFDVPTGLLPEYYRALA